MVADKEVFKGIIMQRREAEFHALRRERERRLAEMRAQKKYEREIARRKAYVTRCRAEVEDRIREMEEQKRREEEAKKKVGWRLGGVGVMLAPVGLRGRGFMAGKQARPTALLPIRDRLCAMKQ